MNSGVFPGLMIGSTINLTKVAIKRANRFSRFHFFAPAIFILIAEVFLSYNPCAQDTLYLKSGEEKIVIVRKVGIDNVEFIRYDNPNGPIYETNKRDILSIKYQNGTVDYFDHDSGSSKEMITNGLIFTDERDSISYGYVVIGEQIWMHENLKYKQGQSVYFTELNTASCKECGRYYNYQEAINACPMGWHLPSDEEWMELEIFAGMSESEAAKKGWRGTYTGQASSLFKYGDTGFDLLLCGWFVPPELSGDDNVLVPFDICKFGYYWTATKRDYKRSYIRHFAGRESIKRYVVDDRYRFPIRCVKDRILENEAIQKPQ